ncbi:MAG: hypothetical protein ABOK23_12350 [Candidatus Methanoperedens sp.]|nr:hypothetical protein [Candidatus Methanoperedens sp.]MCZ7396621.1 hypothetical protein [Candidatus Methanoperedens sp.]
MFNYRESGLLERLDAYAIPIRTIHKRTGKARNNFVILYEHKMHFPELKLSFLSANDLFLTRDITSLSLLSMHFIIDYVSLPGKNTISCLSTPIEKWTKKMIFADEETLKYLIHSPAFPLNYKKRFSEIIEDIKKEIDSLKYESSPSSPETQELVDYYLSIIKTPPKMAAVSRRSVQ